MPDPTVDRYVTVHELTHMSRISECTFSKIKVELVRSIDRSSCILPIQRVTMQRLSEQRVNIKFLKADLRLRSSAHCKLFMAVIA